LLANEQPSRLAFSPKSEYNVYKHNVRAGLIAGRLCPLVARVDCCSTAGYSAILLYTGPCYHASLSWMLPLAA
jgi:hypothetical protein